MAEQIYFEDVEVGTEIPPLVKHPTTVQLFTFSAVLQLTHRIHYDKDFAAKEDHPDILVHGPLHGAFLVQLMTDWIGKQGLLKKISYQNRARAFPGDTLTCKAKVTKKYVKDGERVGTGLRWCSPLMRPHSPIKRVRW